MQCMVHAATDPGVAKPQDGSGAARVSPGLVQRWRWKYYPSSIEMWDGPEVGDNQNLFGCRDWQSLQRDDNICVSNKEMVQGVNG